MPDDLNGLNLPDGISLGQFMCTWPGEAAKDNPLPNIAGFDRLSEVGDKDQIGLLVEWIEPQAVCDWLIRMHGYEGLKRVLKGIAKAASRHKVTMGTRVRGYAGALGLQVY
tara:strand:+ start:898 stop:1230 length:333 start_codon:yes stop_codon:yes gene_type:complete